MKKIIALFMVMALFSTTMFAASLSVAVPGVAVDIISLNPEGRSVQYAVQNCRLSVTGIPIPKRL